MSLSLLPFLCLSLCLPAWNALKVSQPYRAVGHRGEVELFCSYHHTGRHEPEELRVTLYRGMYGEQEKQKVCTSSFTHNETAFQTEGEGERKVHCQGRLGPGRVNLTISGLRGNDTDLYRCAIEVLYPPPYLRTFGNGTLLHITEEPGCFTPEAQRRDDIGETSVRLPLAGLAAATILIVISAITILLVHQVLQRKRRFGAMTPMISQNDGKFDYGNFQ
ncbi:cytotoxic T-lymphocyte protein 4 [Coregonus clupeaformis]|uniref:cytotoxic T-lymphocyte protein 4 n=1 Tax=Coregonus clupeaformis TaxID=59861 RepID=UPI001E1C80F4|nr:cytotoxic T-lymphocyte protein 4 [Coregonus clupeaformis]